MRMGTDAMLADAAPGSRDATARRGLAAAILLGALALVAGCSRAGPGQRPTPEAPFSVAEGNALVEADTEPRAPGAAVDAVGRLEDTGALNLFTVYRVEGERVLSRNLVLAARLREAPGTSAWVRLTGRLDARGRVEAGRADEVEGLGERLERAALDACALVGAQRGAFDLNAYKRTARFGRAFPELDGTDLNALPFRPERTVAFVDLEARRAGVVCGRTVLRETAQRGDYLSFLAICDLGGTRTERVLVKNTGYFLE